MNIIQQMQKLLPGALLIHTEGDQQKLGLGALIDNPD
jgi:hypothetical protein